MPGSPALLDHRYHVSSLVFADGHERRFTGRHVELDLAVRITALRPTAAGDTVTAAGALRFWTLAQQAASLRHPALPRLRDSFRAGDDYILIEDAVAGETLAERIERQGCLSLHETLALGLRLCDALVQAAHVCAGLLPFTTITPYTVVFLPNGHVVLTDLGSRRWLGLPRTAPEPKAAPYSAPEVAGCTSLDVRADVFSVAAVMYHIFTGRVPAAWNQDANMLDAVGPAIPPALSRVFEHALAAEPAVRYDSAEHLGRAIAMAARIVLPDAATLTVPIARRRRRAKSFAASEVRGDKAGISTSSAVAATPALLSRTAQIASGIVHLPLPPAVRRALERKGASTRSAFHFDV
ncbi:MAG TPA: hypothetical protein VGS80_09640 [Ktedonobacterales bacterium]|nr:hypothetical protein [Ktedonobacterales bacterium]